VVTCWVAIDRWRRGSKRLESPEGLFSGTVEIDAILSGGSTMSAAPARSTANRLLRAYCNGARTINPSRLSRYQWPAR
jgi:hypothetical protein